MPEQDKKEVKSKVGRDAKTGRFITAAQAKRRKATAVPNRIHCIFACNYLPMLHQVRSISFIFFLSEDDIVLKTQKPRSFFALPDILKIFDLPWTLTRI